METIKSYGIRAAAERLGIQPTALIGLLVSLGWISKGNHARATSQCSYTHILSLFCYHFVIAQ